MNAPTDAETVSLQIPRSALTIVERPRCVSQRTSEAVLGIARRPFLELLREWAADGGTVLAVGKLRIAEVEPLMEWLRRTRPVAPPESDDSIAAAIARNLRGRR